MATPPIRLQIGTDWPGAIPLLNQNFDNVIQNIQDLGANVSTILTIPFVVPATSLQSQVVTLTSKGVVSNSVNQVFTQQPVSSVNGISPAADIYIDVDNDIGHLFPLGASLTNAQLNLFPIITPQNTGFQNSVGAWLIQINNRDSVPHTYYVHTLCGYFPSAPAGVFR